MSFLDHLPEHVGALIRSRFVCEWASVSKAGVPINSPLVPFTSDDLTTIDCATGLAYPAKAERARRNPKIGMLFEGGASEPVVSISGMAAVRDTDLQANLERYLSEEILTTMLDPASTDYAEVTRHAIWYFTRIVVCAKPAVVRWWDASSSLDEAPYEWRAPAATSFPASDPAPPGAMARPVWAEPLPWRELAKGAVGRGAPGHLTLIDREGYPLPIRAGAITMTQSGFSLEMPGWLPWSAGKATLSFEGVEVFVGDVDCTGSQAAMTVERALPILPLLANPSEILQPRPETKQALMERIDQELARRGVSLPTMPDTPPQPTAGARFRAEAAYGYAGLSGIRED
ncbi:MAG: pyridoxamine 5'-phosphate oxidase family protein [Novosphingobium sp.]|nr:pyridoxamine 5'-phosphate oxidase family protein [Novosphingobium sp.]